MNKKKIISIILAAALCTGLCSCGEKKNAENGASNGKMTISWLGIPWYGTSKEGGYAEKLLEDKYDIEISPLFYDKDGYADKKSVTMLGGNIPDLIYELDPADVKNDVKQGFIQEIPFDLIKEKAPDYFAFINENCPQAWSYSNVDGKNYGLPNLDYSGNIPSNGVWRKDWLEKVGINKIPETLDEMHDALYKFRNDDPDGNGQKDTYGMTGDVKTWHMMFNNIFGAYNARPFVWVKTDKGIEYGGLQSNVKEALKTLSQWYKEEIIDPEFISDSIWDNSKFINGRVGYIANGGGGLINDVTNEHSLINQVTAVTPTATVENSFLPKGPNGDCGAFVWGYAAHVVSFGKNCDEEKLDKLLTMMNDMIKDDDLAVKLHMGEYGTMWKYKDDSLKEGGGVEYTKEWEGKYTENALSYQMGFSFFDPVHISFKLAEKFVTDADKEYQKEYIPENAPQGDYFGKVDVVPSGAKYIESLRNQQIIIMTKIIRGEQSVDSYDEFLKYWESQGGAELTKEANEMDATLQNIYKEIGVK